MCAYGCVYGMTFIHVAIEVRLEYRNRLLLTITFTMTEAPGVLIQCTCHYV